MEDRGRVLGRKVEQKHMAWRNCKQQGFHSWGRKWCRGLSVQYRCTGYKYIAELCFSCMGLLGVEICHKACPLPELQRPCRLPESQPHLWWKASAPTKATWVSEVQPSTWVKTLYSTTGHPDQKTREETETKEQNTHPTKTRTDVSTQKYNVPKHSCLASIIKTH